MTTAPPKVASIDSWVNEARRSDTHGPDRELLVSHGSGTRRFAYVFAHRPWSDSRGVSVVAAYLDLYLSQASPAGAITAQLRRVEQQWNEKTLAWNARPTVDTSLVVTATIASASAIGTRVRFDVTALLQAVADGLPYFGVEISLDPAATAGPVRFASSENGNVARRPTLTATWTAPPDVPVDLRPAGSRYVSSRKPLLAWSFGDVLDPTAFQTAYQVQISTVSTFASTEYDSTKITSGRSALDLNATAYAGLPTDGSLRYWRVTVWDDGGEQSDWSDPVPIRYAPLGSVAITAPGATTPDVRPEVAWTYTPGAAPATTQAAYRARIEKLVSGVWTQVDGADSGLVAGTATSWVPIVPLSDLAASYRAIVDVYDSLAREAIVGAPAAATQTQNFAIAPGGGVTDPAGLTATVVDDYAVRLNWTRATRPQSWAIEIDGKILQDQIDLTPTGTAYVFTYYGVLPRKATTIKLHAVELVGVQYVLSAGVSVVVTTNPVGIWLVDPDTGTQIHIAGREALDAQIGEESSVYPRLGAQAPVVVTEIVRGYEGNVSGTLLDWISQNGRTAHAAIIALRRSNADLRLLLGDLNMPVAIFGLDANPTPRPGDTAFDVGFGFVQIGEFDR